MNAKAQFFRSLERLTWYEWIGWIIELITICFGILFVYTHVCLDEMRAAYISLAFFGAVSSGWMWVLVKYHPERKNVRPN
ncbi:MAG TPA: hypothetical protein PLG17_01275 [Thermodesulfobacteriota bacterium]|nr:hypothetical protein [Deltaproteobacteria bacterium]HNR12770.1 hypothetical protein [Thermodesulfobacteriota bacterium]HNU72561.1 hypothetical protein [Thermodesulfobacteriota bacterium]HOC38698.1 hypothetical protein [Thermodesulfobacteriota bacterium]HQO77122.1 hypothetical protein [Thermodesulfobacteriota bacterium]